MGYHQIPVEQRKLYHDAEKAQWDEWLKFGSAKPLSPEETAEVRRTVHKSRILRSRFVYRDKNASLRTPQKPLPVKAKARLVVAGQNCPDCASGKVRVDAPTIQRTSVLVFLQTVANLGWASSLRSGDVASAFLQGTRRDGVDPIYFEQPRGRGLNGMKEGCLVKVIKGVFGLPDAPRAWWTEVSGYLTRDAGFHSCRMDPAFFIWYHKDGSIGALIILHVDDLLIATDSSGEAELKIDAFMKKYKIGDLTWAERAAAGIEYTGKTIVVMKDGAGKFEGIKVHQTSFIQGRLDPAVISKARRADGSALCTPLETTEFRSMVGSLHWVSGLTRPDCAYVTNQLQKRQSGPCVDDLKMANKAIAEIKDTSDLGIVLRPMSNKMVVVVWTDSALYNSQGELIENDEELAKYDKHKVHSQAGSLVGVMNQDDLDKDGDLPVSVLDWRSRATKRVVTSTFAAESAAAAEGLGLALFLRALIAEVYHGSAKLPTEWDEDVLPTKIVVDCKSLFDNMCKEASVPDDRWTAIYIAQLRCAVSAGPGRREDRTEMLWVPSRWQLADGLTKKGLGDRIRSLAMGGVVRLHEVSEQEIKRRKVQARSRLPGRAGVCAAKAG